MKTISDNIKAILSLMVVIFSFALLLIIILQHVNDKEIVSQVLIAVVSALAAITSYYYGYSQGASKKDETIATQASNTASPIIQQTGDNPIATTDAK